MAEEGRTARSDRASVSRRQTGRTGQLPHYYHQIGRDHDAGCLLRGTVPAAARLGPLPRPCSFPAPRLHPWHTRMWYGHGGCRAHASGQQLGFRAATLAWLPPAEHVCPQRQGAFLQIHLRLSSVPPPPPRALPLLQPLPRDPAFQRIHPPPLVRRDGSFRIQHPHRTLILRSKRSLHLTQLVLSCANPRTSPRLLSTAPRKQHGPSKSSQPHHEPVLRRPGNALRLTL